MYNFDPYNVFLVIATNIPQRLKTAFVLQGHVLDKAEMFIAPSVCLCDVISGQINT